MDKKIETPGNITVVSWNVQNLFNADEDGNEYTEYLPSSGWNNYSYRDRLSRVETVFSYAEIRDADVVVLNEVENESVVEDIMELPFFKKRGLCFYVCAGSKKGAIKTAVISRIPIVDAVVHDITDGRPVLQVELQNLNERFFILAVHAKSNLEGVEETADIRKKQAELIRHVADDIEAEYPDALIIAAGDFNESYTSCNMMCDCRNIANEKYNCPLRLLSDFRCGYWFCPWLDINTEMQAEGSYCYSNNWYCYDNILISSAGGDGYGWEYKNGGVVFTGILQTTDFKPNAFRRELLTGVSDHLPVWITLTD